MQAPIRMLQPERMMVVGRMKSMIASVLPSSSLERTGIKSLTTLEPVKALKSARMPRSFSERSPVEMESLDLKSLLLFQRCLPSVNRQIPWVQCWCLQRVKRHCLDQRLEHHLVSAIALYDFSWKNQLLQYFQKVIMLSDWRRINCHLLPRLNILMNQKNQTKQCSQSNQHLQLNSYQIYSISQAKQLPPNPLSSPLRNRM